MINKENLKSFGFIDVKETNSTNVFINETIERFQRYAHDGESPIMSFEYNTKRIDLLEYKDENIIFRKITNKILNSKKVYNKKQIIYDNQKDEDIKNLLRDNIKEIINRKLYVSNEYELFIMGNYKMISFLNNNKSKFIRKYHGSDKLKINNNDYAYFKYIVNDYLEDTIIVGHNNLKEYIKVYNYNNSYGTYVKNGFHDKLAIINIERRNRIKENKEITEKFYYSFDENKNDPFAVDYVEDDYIGVDSDYDMLLIKKDKDDIIEKINLSLTKYLLKNKIDLIKTNKSILSILSKSSNFRYKVEKIYTKNYKGKYLNVDITFNENIKDNKIYLYKGDKLIHTIDIVFKN